MTHWADHREFSTGYLRLWFLYQVYRLFGRRVLKMAVFPIVLCAFTFMFPARRASRDYLAALYGVTKNPAHRPTFRHSFKHFYTFSQALIDKVAAWSGDIKRTDVIVADSQLADTFLKRLKQKRGIFVLCSHLGNIEVLRAAVSGDMDIRVNAFIDMEQTQHFNDFIRRVNSAAPLNLYSTRRIGLETSGFMKSKLDAGEVIVMAADRVAAPNAHETISKPFLGKMAQFPKGAFTFARLMECDICFMAICLNDTGKYQLHLKIHPAGADMRLADMVADYAEWLEKLTLRYPYQWYNFYEFWNNS